MKIFLCIDDTDNIESKGTGSIASEIAGVIETSGWGNCQSITRHQLLVHPDVPYTSHNSSMCFTAEIKEECLESVIQGAILQLEAESAEGSDPGLCVVMPERLTQLQQHEIVEFGLKAKREVLTKEQAYQLAESLSIHLSEHGGTGQGVIGALAGVGLRLTGNDGRFKGHHKLKSDKLTVTVQEILDETSIEMIRTESGLILDHDQKVRVGDKLKSVFLNQKPVLLVEPANFDGETMWQPSTGGTLKKY